MSAYGTYFFTDGDPADFSQPLSPTRAPVLAPPDPDAPCIYIRHRDTDWRLAEGGPVVCGVCHPAPPQMAVRLIVTRNDPGFDA